MKGIISVLLVLLIWSCTSDGETDPPKPPEPPQVENEVDFYLTKGDQSQKFAKQPGILAFGSSYNAYASIKVSTSETYQTVAGFGFTLTGGSAEVINSLTASKKQELLDMLFGKGENAIGISYLRISVGASDLNSSPYSYNDLPAGATDEDLSEFSLEKDLEDVIPLLQEILEINPEIGIMATPWSAPVWMKDNQSFVGGSLQPQYYDVYADYLVKYIKAMEELGIEIHALTPQNEPLHAGNNPSMHMTAAEQTNFIKNSLGPEFAEAGVATDIIIYDHNADNPGYPISILNDPLARQYVAGSAFHLYAGDISALSTVHDAYPNKDIYFTEQYTSSTGDFGGDLKWHLRNVIIGSMRNWSKTALEWNLANDSSFGPHTDGGCTTCKGAITVNSSGTYTENVGYYIIAHASKFVPPGSVRISSNIIGNLQNVAFRTPSGVKVLIVLNDGNSSENFNIEYNGEWITTSLSPGAVGTYVWE
ncbi:glycoside hydrolase family 30 protein [Salinimicrobium oceani]|uniref:Glucosylceramidase n=1 Tax=Salinimicrobium oceani TaxID=2722702 RepID=A0ABX1CWJ5_9FLAO|nr:glycoside hydrolase family 30 beta sandwich domain-containing protein [Salinimicrobium oceani]NJW52132.1 glucosylceramidase [Salinimicrobium oceani]